MPRCHGKDASEKAAIVECGMRRRLCQCVGCVDGEVRGGVDTTAVLHFVCDLFEYSRGLSLLRREWVGEYENKSH